MNKIRIGIDFGTTNTSVGYMKYNSFMDIYTQDCFNLRTQKVMKTLITYENEDQFWLGNDAIIKACHHPKYFFKSIKRDLIENKYEKRPGLNKKEDEVIGDYLGKIRQLIEPQLPVDTEIEGVVMGVPIGLSDHIKNRYIQALVRAGFYNSLEESSAKTIFVSEPIAAALDYGVALRKNKNIMVFDFGGGTLDIVIMNLMNYQKTDELSKHEVLAKSGSLQIGGDDLDRAILEQIIVEKYGMKRLLKELNIARLEEINTVEDGIALMEAIRVAKEELSMVNYTTISLLTRNLQLSVEITAEEFEEVIRPYVTKAIDEVHKCLADAMLIPADIDVVVLAGGSSHVVAVQDKLKELFGRTKIKVSEDALTSIARGLALRGYNYEATEYSDILEHSYGIKMLDTDGRTEVIKPILKKGQKVDLINGSDEFYQEFEIKEGARRKNYFKIQVYEDDKELGVVHVPMDETFVYSRFKIRFKVVEGQGKLELELIDASRNIRVKLPIEESQFDYKKGEEK